MTHSVARLPVSRGTFNEIRDKLIAAGYQHAFTLNSAKEVEAIDMTHLELVVEEHIVESKVW